MINELDLLQLIPNRVREEISTIEPFRGTLVAAGWKASIRKGMQGKGSANRIVFVPVDAEPQPAVDPGDPLGARGRERFSLAMGFEVEFWGYDNGSPIATIPNAVPPVPHTDIYQDTGQDMRNVARCIQLLSLTSQALSKLAWGNLAWGRMRWNAKTVEKAHGAILVANLVVRIPVLDLAPLFHKPVHGAPIKGPSPDSEE